MLRSELHKIEVYLAQINGKETDTEWKTRSSRDQWINLFGRECELVQSKWLHTLFSNVREHVLYRYIQFHQGRVTRLSDLVSEAAKAGAGKPGNYRDLYQQVLAQLENLIRCLQNSFPKYFDDEQKGSLYSGQAESQKILAFAESVREISSPGFDTKLKEILVHWMEGTAQASLYQPLSSRQADQMAMVYRMIHELSEMLGMDTNIIALALYRQNFNVPAFISWFRAYLLNGILSTSANERNIYIADKVRLLESITGPAEHLFEPDRPPIEATILPWLMDQQVGDKKTRLYAAANANINGHMPLALSVAQFALMVRLLHLEGCFQVTNVSRIHRFFTEHFSTKKQADISVKSFARAFYNSDQPAAAVVRGYLQRMIIYIDKTYFPK